MKKSKLLIALIIVISVFYGNIYAQQSIYVKETNGTLTEIPLTQVQKITFSGSDMVLQKTDATSLTWATSDVQKYYYDLTTGINNIEISRNNDVLIYPNPSNGNFNINYHIKEQGRVNIYIVSIDGKIRRNLLSENKKQGGYLLNVNQYLEAGYYLVKIESNNKFLTKKIIILK